MTVPPGAVFEMELAGGVALWDVSHLLATHPRKKYPERSGTIRKLYTHHSGAMGRDGYKGVTGAGSYVIVKRRFPGFPYTFWLSHVPDLDAYERIVVYRCQRDEVRSWHTGGKANDYGIAVAWQGNLTAAEPSPLQVELAEAFYPWAAERYGLTAPDGFGMHREVDQWNVKVKPSCPGAHVVAWLEDWRMRRAA